MGAAKTLTTSWDASEASFSEAEMEVRLRLLEEHVATRKQAKRIIGLMRKIAERSYSVRFEDGTPLSEQVLMPAMSAESKGMEDARFVRFVGDDGSVTYYASYTAYNGTDIGQQLLETKDFVTLHLLADGRSRRRQQGPCSLPSPDRRPFRSSLPK